MKTLLPPGPRLGARERFRPVARVKNAAPSRNAIDYIRRLSLEACELTRLQEADVQNSGLTGTWVEEIFRGPVATNAYTAVASTASEASLLAGVNEQPIIPATYFDGNKGIGRALRVKASGVLSNTGTPTIIFQLRLGTTAGSTFLSGTSCGVTAAITTGSGVTNKYWELNFDLYCKVPGIGTGNTTLLGGGHVFSGGGFASPFLYALEPTTPDTATWTSTIDASLTQYMNLSVTWSASSASNTITLLYLSVLGIS